MPLPASSTSSYPDLDALLAGARESLARANALDAATNADAQSMTTAPQDSGLDFVNGLAHGVTHDPYATLKGFLSGAAPAAADAAKGLGDAALGFGKMLTTPPSQQATELAQRTAPMFAAGELPSASDVVQGTTGVDPHASYPRMGGQALGALLMAHGLGAEGGRFDFGEPDYGGAVEPKLGPSARSPEAQALRQPQGEGPIPVSSTPVGKPEPFAPNTSDYTPSLAETPPAASETPEPLSPPAAPGKPRLSADDVKGMLAGRDKFAQANPDVSLPPGASDELDRMGIEYGRTQRTLKQLLGMPDADPAEVARMNQGARELGSRLRQTVKGYTNSPEPTPPTSPLDTLEAHENPDYAKVPFDVADDATQNALPGQVDYSGAKLGRVSLKDLIATQPTVTRDVVAQKLGMAPSELDQLPVGANTRPTGQIPEVVQGADGRNYLMGGTHTATAAKLRGDADLQAVLYPTRGSAALAPEALPEDRVGHFKLPETNRPDSFYNKIREAKGIAPSPLAEAAQASSAPASTGPSDVPLDRPITDASGRVIAPPQTDTPLSPPDPRDNLIDAISRFGKDTSGEAELNMGVPVTRQGVANAIDAADPKALGNLFNRYQTASLVGSPTTLGRIGVSNLSNLFQIAAEKAAEARSLGPLADTTRESIGSPRQMGKDFVEGLTTDRGSRYADTSSPLGKMLGMVTRPIGALDYAFRQAGSRAGFSPDEALRISQQQTPSTGPAKALLGIQQRFPAIKAALPILRAPLNLVEQGVVEPLRSAGNIGADALRAVGVDAQRFADNTATPKDYVKTLFAAGAAAGYYNLSDKVDDLPTWAKPLALAAAGSYSIPAAISYAVGHAKDNGGLDAALQEIQRSVPGLEGVTLNTQTIANRLIPRALQQANPDYWNGTKRQTHGLIEKLKARIPGAAQELPINPGATRRAMLGK